MSLLILLDDKIKDIFEKTPELESVKKNKFDLAVAQIINVRYLGGLDLEELVDGVVDKGGDEGIDICYLFHNQEFIRNEEDLKSASVTKSSNFELKIFQVKSERAFSTNVFGKLCEGIKNIIILDEKKLKRIGVNTELIDKAILIQKALRISKREDARFVLNVYYISHGDTSKLNTKDTKIGEYKDQLKAFLRLYIENINFIFWGAEELLNIAALPEEKIEFNVDPTVIDLRDEKKKISGFACFIKGNSILSSLKDDKSGKLKEDFFDANIRDFLGEKKPINQSMINTAQSQEEAENFWAMNNGITIIGSAVRSTSGTSIIVENPQIVNGCQTIYSLYLASLQKGGLSEKVKIFAKIIQVVDSQIQQDIISASNSQNAVEYTGFLANDPVQRLIEKFLSKRNCYYERRANYYKRKGKKGLSVISIKKMGQIVEAIFLKQSIRALNDVRVIFDNEKLYKKIFNIEADYDAYFFSYVLYKNIWLRKNIDLRKHNYGPEKKELISKSLLPIIHIASSLIFDSEKPIDFQKVGKKNTFSLIKESVFKKLNNENEIEQIYKDAKKIYFECAKLYQKGTNRNSITLLKQRDFDRKYIIPRVEKFLNKKLEKLIDK